MQYTSILISMITQFFYQMISVQLMKLIVDLYTCFSASYLTCSVVCLLNDDISLNSVVIVNSVTMQLVAMRSYEFKIKTAGPNGHPKLLCATIFDP